MKLFFGLFFFTLLGLFGGCTSLQQTVAPHAQGEREPSSVQPDLTCRYTAFEPMGFLNKGESIEVKLSSLPGGRYRLESENDTYTMVPDGRGRWKSLHTFAKGLYWLEDLNFKPGQTSRNRPRNYRGSFILWKDIPGQGGDNFPYDCFPRGTSQIEKASRSIAGAFKPSDLCPRVIPIVESSDKVLKGNLDLAAFEQMMRDIGVDLEYLKVCRERVRTEIRKNESVMSWQEKKRLSQFDRSLLI